MSYWVGEGRFGWCADLDIDCTRFSGPSRPEGSAGLTGATPSRRSVAADRPRAALEWRRAAGIGSQRR